MDKIYLGFPNRKIRQWCKMHTLSYVYFGTNDGDYATKVTELTGNVTDGVQTGIQHTTDGIDVNNVDITYISGDYRCGCSAIKNNAFHSCENLKTIDIPNVTSIASYAFSDCTNLSSANFPKVTEIGVRAFSNCSNLSTICCPEVTTVHRSFEECTGLRTISLPKLTALNDESHYHSVSLFNGCINLLSVWLDGVTYIKNACSYIFNNCISLRYVSFNSLSTFPTTSIVFTFEDSKYLEKINIPNVRYFDGYSMEIAYEFSQCPRLSCIYVDNEVLHSIGDGYDFDHSLVVDADEKNLYFVAGAISAISSDTIEIVNNDAFYSNKNLVSAYLPNATSIGKMAFSYCTHLSSLVLSAVTTPTQLLFSPFLACPHISVYVKNDEMVEKFSNADVWKDLLASDQVEFIPVIPPAFGMTTIDGHRYGFVQDEIPMPLKYVDNNGIVQAPYSKYDALSDQLSIIQVDDNDLSATSIGTSAFISCSNLREVNTPYVTSIGAQAFYKCSSLSSIDISTLNVANNQSFYYCDNLENIDIESVTRVNWQAFYGCKKLKEINISNATYIGTGAFLHCDEMTNVNAANVLTVDGWAFQQCGKLSCIQMSNAKTIGEAAFWSCTSLSTIDIKNAQYIGKTAFQNCSKLSTIILNGRTEVATLADVNAFDNIYPDYKIYVRMAAYDDYVSADNWKDISSHIDAGTEVLVNDELKYYQSGSLGSSLNAKAQILSIEQSYGDATLKECISRDPNLTSVSDYSFFGCHSLSSIDLPEVMSIGTYAFYTCTSLTAISLPNVTSIDNYAFFSAWYLSSITLGNTAQVVTLNGVNAFNSMPKNYKVYVPELRYNDYIVATNWSNPDIKKHIAIIPTSTIFKYKDDD